MRKKVRIALLALTLGVLAALCGCGAARSAADPGSGALLAQHLDAVGVEKVTARRTELAAALARRGIELTEHEFEALVSFSCDFGTDWLDGTSLLARIVRGETEETRLETARAFGMWCHVGGEVDEGIARRRLAEAALYLDGTADAADREFAYLALRRGADVEYVTDFAVYERGGTYDAFPVMLRPGYTVDGYRTDDGRVLRAGDKVKGSEAADVIWRRNDYGGLQCPDVDEESRYYDYVMEMLAAGGIGTRSDGTFGPEEPAGADEAAALLLWAAGTEIPAPEDGGDPMRSSAEYALAQGFLTAEAAARSDGTLTRREAARLAARALGLAQATQTALYDDTRDGYAAALHELGVRMDAEESGAAFSPDRALSRGELCTLAWWMRCARTLERSQNLVYTNRSGVYPLEILPDVAKFSYDRDAFSGNGREMDYAEPGVTVRRGIDVSKFQGEIDWEAVKADGIDFAILRVGGRYFGSGKLYDDDRFAENLSGAKAAGLDVGVYFFSQAITPEEAVQEAEYVLGWIRGAGVELPVVFDWELSGKSGARTNGMSAEAVTDCAVAFCERIRAAGYRPMVYFTRYQGYIKYDLSRLTEYAFWYADDYEKDVPEFFYDFAFWQYSTRGRVAGIPEAVDLDLWLSREG